MRGQIVRIQLATYPRICRATSSRSIMYKIISIVSYARYNQMLLIWLTASSQTVYKNVSSVTLYF